MAPTAFSLVYFSFAQKFFAGEKLALISNYAINIIVNGGYKSRNMCLFLSLHIINRINSSGNYVKF